MEKKFSFLIACFLTLLALVGCSSSAEDTDSEGQIVIGAYGPLSGETAQYGESMKNNMEMYFNEVNENGGIDGREIKLIVEDDEGKPDKGINAVKKLIEKDKAVAILGGPLSNVNLATMIETQKSKIPHVSTSGGNEKITSLNNPYIMRVVTKDNDIAAAVTEYAVKEAGYKKIGILYSADEYGKGGSEAANTKLKELGVTPISSESFNPGEKDFTAQLLKFKDAETIILWGFYVDGAIVAKQIKELGIDAQLIGGTGLNNPKFIELAGEASEGVLFGSPFIATNPEIADYVNSYKETYGQVPDMTGATGYDAAQLIVAALKEVGTDKEKINEWLHNVKDFEGVTGLLTATKNGDLNDSVLIIEVHKDGSQTIKWNPQTK